MAELTDEQVFGTQQKELSDADVFGSAPQITQPSLTESLFGKSSTNAATEYGQQLGPPSIPELAATEQQFSQEHPYIYGATKAVAGMVPTSGEQIKQLLTLPRPVQETTSGETQQKNEQWGQAVRGELGPVAQAETITGTALQALPLAGLPFAETPLRATAADLALVDRLRQPSLTESVFGKPTAPETPSLTPETPITDAATLSTEDANARLNRILSTEGKITESQLPSETKQTIGGEPNASQITSPESVSVPTLRQEVGGETPLRQQGETAAARQETQPTVTTPQEVAPEPETSTSVTEHPTVEVPLSKITLSKDVPQFKAGANEKGVIEPIAGKYERVGTAPVQIWQRSSGDMELISGRHRLDLAQRTGEETIPAQIHKESEGFNQTAAARLDAELNIRDNQGSTGDYANYFKNSELSQGDAESRGLLARAKGKAGFEIARNGSEDLFALHQSGRITDAQAQGIASAAPGNPGAQQVGIRAALEGKSADFASNLIKAATAHTQGAPQTGDLFSFDDTAMRQMEDQARVASQEQRNIREQISAVSGASKKPEVAAKLGVDVKDPASVQAKVAELKTELSRWENWPTQPDLVARTRGETYTSPTEAAPVATPKGEELFSPQEIPFNLTGETESSTVKPPEQTTAFGNETLSQKEMFGIQQITELKDPFKSADAAQQIHGDPITAANAIERQLRIIDADPKVKAGFVKEQRQRLKEVVNLLRERAENQVPESTSSGMTPQNNVVVKTPKSAPLSPQALGITHPMPSFIKDIADTLVGLTPRIDWPGGTQLLNRIKGALGTISGKTFPKTTIADKASGELASRWISSKIAAPHVARTFATQVLEGTNLDPHQFGTALTEDNLRSVKQGFIDAGDTESADRVGTTIGGKNSPFKTEQEYQEFLHNPVVQSAIERHRSLWNETVEPMYKNAMSIDPEETLPARGAQTSARINLNAVQEGKPKTAVTTVGQGNLLGTMRKKSPFGRQATGAGQYDTDYFNMMENTFGRQMEIANKNAFEKQLVDSGNAVVGKPGQQVVLPDGESTVPFPLKRKTSAIFTNAEGQPQTVPINQNLYVRKSLANEYRRGANVDLIPVPAAVKSVSNAFNKSALAGLTDATVHITNLGTVLMTRPGVTGGALADTLLSLTGRADVPVTLTKAVIKGMQDNSKQIAELGQIGALREEFPTINPLGKAIKWADRTTRLVMDDTYQQLVKNGIMEDSETNRREFINQVGQYNKRAQGDLIRLARDTGLGPFATAGRTFINLGIKNMTLNPGAKAANLTAAAALRGQLLAKWVGALGLVGTLNYITTGKMMGRPGGKIGDIDTGKDDANGRPLRFNALNLMGYGRALRVSGVQGAVTAKRMGLTNTDAMDSATRDIANSAISPFAGPPVRFLFSTFGGSPAIKVPGPPVAAPGESQFYSNLKYALKEANPIVASIHDALQPGADWHDAARRQLPRFTLTPTQPPEMVEKYPEIVHKAQALQFIDDTASRARKLEKGESRDGFIQRQLDRLSPEDQEHAKRVLKYKRVEWSGEPTGKTSGRSGKSLPGQVETITK